MNRIHTPYSILWLLLSLSNPASAVVTVGESPGFGTCDHTTIQDAIDSGDPEIRILNNQDFTENLIIDRTIDLRGGYNSCLAAQLNTTGEIKTTILGSQVLGKPVIEITTGQNAIPVPLVRLFDLVLSDATDTPFTDGGRGIEIGNSSVFLGLIDSEISNNTAENGAGIYLDNPLNSTAAAFTAPMTIP